MEQESSTYEIIIKYNPNAKDKTKQCICDPGELHVKPGDFVFFTVEQTDVRIYIYESDSLFVDEPEDLRFSVDGKNPSKEYEIRADAKQKGMCPGKYVYAVYCLAGEDFAVGNSTPKIIVE